MMHSPTSGLVAQLNGFLTGKHYRSAAVFVDHCSGAGYIHLQKTQSVEETLEGKACFERHCQLMGHKVLHHHADNGIFMSKAWQESCAKLGQVFTYSGVNAHFQNRSGQTTHQRALRDGQILHDSCSTSMEGNNYT
jgi:hypothetical protein